VNDHGGVINANLNVSGLAPTNETLYIQAASFTNHGTAEATGGGILQIGDGTHTWTNAADGTISATNSMLDLITFDNLGTITTTNSAVFLDGNDTFANVGNFHRNGGSVTLRGTLNLGGQTLDTTQGAASRPAKSFDTGKSKQLSRHTRLKRTSPNWNSP
jgi:hypothetical protein